MPPVRKKRAQRKAKKKVRCEFCSKLLCQESIAAHLGRFTKPPKLNIPDGIHDVERIRQYGNSAKPFRFLSLPAELRIKIYGYILCHDVVCPIKERVNTYSRRGEPYQTFNHYITHREWPAPTHPQAKKQTKTWFRYGAAENYISRRADYALRMLATCRQIYHEAATVFYSQNRFVFHAYHFQSLMRFLAGIGRERTTLLRSVWLVLYGTASSTTTSSTSPNCMTDLTSLIQQHAGTVDVNPWNQDELLRHLRATLWQHTRARLTPWPGPGGGEVTRQTTFFTWVRRSRSIRNQRSRIEEYQHSMQFLPFVAGEVWPGPPFWIVHGFEAEPEYREV